MLLAIEMRKKLNCSYNFLSPILSSCTCTILWPHGCARRVEPCTWKQSHLGRWHMIRHLLAQCSCLVCLFSFRWQLWHQPIANCHFGLNSAALFPYISSASRTKQLSPKLPQCVLISGSSLIMNWYRICFHVLLLWLIRSVIIMTDKVR